MRQKSTGQVPTAVSGYGRLQVDPWSRLESSCRLPRPTFSRDWLCQPGRHKRPALAWRSAPSRATATLSIHVLNPSCLALAKQAIIDYSFSFSLACCRHLKPLVYPQLRFSLHILGLLRCAFTFPQDREPMSGLTPQHGLTACNTVLIKIWPVIVKLSTW